MIKLPIDQKYQIIPACADTEEYSGLSIQRASNLLRDYVSLCPKICLDGSPSNIITIKEKPIHSIMTPFRSLCESIYIGDIQDGITCIFTPEGNATKLTISKRSVFLNDELVEFVLDRKLPFTKGQEVVLTGEALEKFFHENPNRDSPLQGKVEGIDPMDDGTFLVTFRDTKTDWGLQYDSKKLELVQPKLKVGDIVRLTKKRLSEGKGQKPREGKINRIHHDGGICFTHKEGQACCFSPKSLELDPIELAFKVGDKVKTIENHREELMNRYHIEGFSGTVLQMHNDSGTISSTVKISEGLPIRVSTRFLTHQKCPDFLEFLNIPPRPITKCIPSHNLKTEPPLYYIVRKGTNARFNDSAIQSYTLQGQGFLIVDSENIKQELQEINNSVEGTFEAISISDYEQKFGQDCHEYKIGEKVTVYYALEATISKHNANLYEIKEEESGRTYTVPEDRIKRR